MRRINERVYEVWKVDGRDDYGQQGHPVDTGRRVRCNVAARDQVVVEDSAKFILSYYNGLTWERGLKVGEQLRHSDKKYKITSVNEDARQVQLILEAV